MAAEQQLSDVTKIYLKRFYEILDEMIAGMTGAKLTSSISHDFIVQMIPHHRAAIEMSRSILKYTTSIPLQNIAQNIIKSQTKSIENMQKALGCCSKVRNSGEDIKCYREKYGKITDNMFSQMRDACSTNNVNADFIREMIPHHRGAIKMSKNALSFEICGELIPILEAIITSQEKGVQEMQALLKCIET